MSDGGIVEPWRIMAGVRHLEGDGADKTAVELGDKTGTGFDAFAGDIDALITGNEVKALVGVDGVGVVEDAGNFLERVGLPEFTDNEFRLWHVVLYAMAIDSAMGKWGGINTATG